MVKSGQYAIVNCGEHADTVVTMLQTLWGALIDGIRDVELPPTSPAYRTFFKDPENMAYVDNILAYAAAGAAIHPPNVWTNGAPAIVCLTAPGQLHATLPSGAKFDAYSFCLDRPTLAGQSLTGTPYIGLCPRFWESGLGTNLAFPPPTGKCLSVSPNNRFNVDRLGRAGPSVTHYAMWILLQMIIDIYLLPEQQRRGYPVGSNTFDANEIFLRLPADQSMVNAPSYVLYIASTLPSIGFWLPKLRREPADDGYQVCMATALSTHTP